MESVAVSDLTQAVPQRPSSPLVVRRRGPSGASALILVLLAAHALAAVVMSISPLVSTLHAAATVLVVGWISCFSIRPERLTGAAAYVVGCEVLWRQTEAQVPWELSLYLLVAIFFVGLVRFAPRPPRRARAAVPIIYLVLLVPGAFATITAVGVIESRALLGFYLAGPVALALGVLVHRSFWIRWEDLRPILWLMIMPIMGTLFLATTHAIGLSPADFLAGESNYAASGGYGPNQVSAVIGAVALAGAFLTFKERTWTLRATAFGLVVWCLAQGALTFSRGGLVNVLVAAAFALPHFVTRVRHLTAILAGGALLFVLGGLLLFPRLQELTGGTLEQRLTSGDGSRAELASIDVEVFRDNVAAGVGVGLSEEQRGDGSGRYAAHTEYTRLLAEHGLFGLAAVLCLVLMAIGSYTRAAGTVARAWTAALIGWTAAEMAHSAMRLAITAFIFSLAALAVIDPDRPPPVATPARGRSTRADPPTPSEPARQR